MKPHSDRLAKPGIAPRLRSSAVHELELEGFYAGKEIRSPRICVHRSLVSEATEADEGERHYHSLLWHVDWREGPAIDWDVLPWIPSNTFTGRLDACKVN